RADVLACQLLSEPDAGSDLASVRTVARRDGEEWIVNGQKVWSSRAQVADVGLLLARTNPDAAKHHGLTTFLLPMRTPGVNVRPLRRPRQRPAPSGPGPPLHRLRDRPLHDAANGRRPRGGR